MLFNLLARAAERHFPDLVQLLDKTRLFVFPGRAHEVLGDGENIDFEFLRENFILPFQHVAVEDTASCILLWDSEPDHRGLSGIRYFLECASFRTPLDEFNDKIPPEEKKVISQRMAEIDPEVVVISKGLFHTIELRTNEDGHTQFWYDATVTDSAIVFPNGRVVPTQLFQPSQSDVVYMTNGVIRNAGAAVQEIYYFSAPERFILEETPEGYDERRKKARRIGRVVRKHERPIYTVLYPHEIRKRLNLPPVGTGSPKQPHERRRHTRTYPDNPIRWPNVHGKTIVIDVMWIGPSEAKIGRKMYRVLLDR